MLEDIDRQRSGGRFCVWRRSVVCDRNEERKQADEGEAALLQTWNVEHHENYHAGSPRVGKVNFVDGNFFPF